MLIGKKYCCNDNFFFYSNFLQRKLNTWSIFDNICKNMFFNATVVNNGIILFFKVFLKKVVLCFCLVHKQTSGIRLKEKFL